MKFHTLDVFTAQAYGGNPLAVVLDADALKPAQMQRIAREFNLSETVFLQTATRSQALLRARIYTPLEELPFAGHPLVGTACLIAELGLAPAADFILDVGVGPVAVRTRREPGMMPYASFQSARLPEFGPPPPPDADIAATLGLETGDIGRGEQRPCHASCGLPFLLVPLRAPELLAGIDVDRTRLRALIGAGWAHSLYAYAHGYEGELRARMFSPRLEGEDPATGSAACALAGRLAHDAAPDARLAWVVHQGVEMGRPSQLHIEADRAGGATTAIRVGGHAVRILEGHLHAM